MRVLWLCVCRGCAGAVAVREHVSVFFFLGLPRRNTAWCGLACSRFALRAPGAPKRSASPVAGAQSQISNLLVWRITRTALAVSRCRNRALKLGRAKTCTRQAGATRYDSARLGTTQRNSARLGTTQRNSERLGSTRRDSARLGTTQHDSARLGATRRDPRVSRVASASFDDAAAGA